MTRRKPIAASYSPADARLRERMETAIEKLIAALDALEDTDTDAGGDDFPIDEPYDEREGDDSDDEEHEPSGIGDHDGLMEQAPKQFEHTDIGVEQ